VGGPCGPGGGAEEEHADLHTGESTAEPLMCGRVEGLVRCGSPQEAVEALLPRVREVGVERVPLAEAAGRILAEPVLADRPSPACDVSAMDGYAVRMADLSRAELPLAGEVRIGVRPPELPPGAALRIVTGAPIPPGAETVVKREDVEELASSIRPGQGARSLSPGANIRRRGDNAGPGDPIVGLGCVITAPGAAALASFGCATPTVRSRVRAAILSTGDEVLDVSQAPTEWQLRDGNAPAIAAMLGAPRWIDVVATRRAPDDPRAIAAAAEGLLAGCDALVLSGGVSMGDRDFVPRVLRELGATVVFHRVPQRPGRPVLGAVLPDGRPAFGLPGNPLSVMVTCRRIVLPVLERMAGITRPSAPPAVRLRGPGDKSIELWWHRAVRIVAPGEAELASTASSGDVAGAAESDGFVELPPGASGPGPWPFYGW
jgi:molybdopterin molybdotransferase